MADIIPFDKRDGFIWIDGEFSKWQDTKLHVLTHGLHYGSCVFEGERAYNGKIFKGVEHSERLVKSAELLDMKIPYSIEEIEAAKYATLEKQGLKDAYIRAFAWRGSEMMGISAQNNKIHLAIAAWNWPSYYSAEQKLQGIKLGLAKYKRPSPETAPYAAKAAGLYMICTISKHQAEREGFSDALMLDYRGQVAEATSANVFFIKGDTVHTPIADCFLDGITRRTVIAMARANGINVVERVIMPDELGTFDGCFLTGTAAEVTPVGQIGQHHYKVSSLLERIMNDYSALVRGI